MVRKLILEKLEELGLTMSEASLKIGKNHAYLQQFLKRGYPLELPEKSRIPLARLLGVPEDSLRGSSAALTTRIHSKPEAKISTRKDHVAQPSISGTEPQNFLDSVRPFPNMVARALPVFGTIQGADEALVLSDHPVDWEAMPDFLANVKDAYGMFVSGDTMDPEHKNGSTCLVHPQMPPNPGNTVILRCRKDDGIEVCCIRHLVRFTNTHWYVSQHNPKKNFTLKRTDWPTCHVAVGNLFRLV